MDTNPNIAITGHTAPATGIGGWLDGVKDLAFGYGNAWLNTQFPERVESQGQPPIVIDGEVEGEKAEARVANMEMYLKYGAIALAGIAGLLVLKKVLK